MATFTQEEIDFIKERGNEYCRRIWLGLMNSNSPQTLDTKDEQKMKDLMSAKYELKRYYLDPSMANQNSNQNSNQKLQSSNQTNIPRVPHSGTSTLSSISTQKINNSESVNSNNFSTDFVADFSKVPDPFITTTTPTNKLSQPIVPQPFFANFDNNPVFNSPKNTNIESSSPFSQTTGNSTNIMNANGTYIPPSEDRYAALKDLDSLMKQTQLKDDTPATLNTSTWNSNNASNSVWNVGNQTTNVISNPFVTGDLWRPSANVVNNNTQSIDTSIYNPVNPFKPAQFPINNDPQWVGIGSSNNRDVIQFSQLMTNKVWQPTLPAYHANPFMVGSGVSNMTRNSNNPFL
ncbi:arf GTPase activating protein drongo isoform X2 [Osmia lignaria lignaria]|nr:arf-GAP domain and FG repeat-containing protein 2 isoform X4 [Osmia bicornis bicornis]XP_029056640.1 arf-GAP domain and FG repeat-containing protein 2 isoform X4 [Osmia bicornis bicornis]XP_034189389.1 arf-GAP domain and FG repeat-containing protein 2 isoform X2 [Osmia lignaria]XP_034189390.1 arf-GAP domain and FG repeat-containing protein 2 isoform X2 [Osmia lignaria]XP_034189391.1 arf-GAP domain and FG repeat-containing protein 2 isoform X2 [Osmia lignaria]